MRAFASFPVVAMVALSLAVSPNHPARAAVITVMSTSGATGGPDCTLRDAMTAAKFDDPVGGCPAGSGADVIELTPGATYTLFEVDNTVGFGNTGLPFLTIGTVTINGHGATIERSRAKGTPGFRLFFLAGAASLTLNGLTLTNGLAEVGEGTLRAGGAIMSFATLRLVNCTITANSSPDLGGGIYVADGSFEMVNSTVSGNDAPRGGGVYFDLPSGASASLVNSTITDNSAEQGAGILYAIRSKSLLTLVNTIVADQRLGDDCSRDFGVLTSLGHNLDSDGTCLADGVGGDRTGPALLGPLQDNGGPSATHALFPCSPAVDAGDDDVCNSAEVDARDQRGVSRPQGAGCDIGAFELEGGVFDPRDLNRDGRVDLLDYADFMNGFDGP